MEPHIIAKGEVGWAILVQASEHTVIAASWDLEACIKLVSDHYSLPIEQVRKGANDGSLTGEERLEIGRAEEYWLKPLDQWEDGVTFFLFFAPDGPSIQTYDACGFFNDLPEDLQDELSRFMQP